MKARFTKYASVLLAAGVAGFAGLQFVRPTLDNPPVTADIAAPAPVEAVLRKACYDCHSNETHLAWFDRISPAIWLVARHVNEGRAVLDFSHWDRLNEAQRRGKLFESLNQMTFGTMPPSEYTMLHPDAKLTEQDLAVLRDWLSTQMAPIGHDTPKPHAEVATPAAHEAKTANPTPNGISFFPDYKNWEAVSSTDRADNGTMRVILANDVAVKAIASGDTNPWPTGAILAKVAWDQIAEPDGSVHPGEFKQVEFMIKDRTKYAHAAGWGWARWKGTQLQPYGENETFTTECVHCHQPMEKNDFVFTQPIRFAGGSVHGKDRTPRTINEAASLPNTPLLKPHAWRVITSSIDPRAGTMSTLYGNELAVKHAREDRGAYSAGAELSLITWKRVPDEHWFGAYVPGTMQTIEQVTFASGSDTPAYVQYEGDALKKTPDDPERTSHRIAYIASQRPSAMP